MLIWMIKMEDTNEIQNGQRMFYVYGSGLIAVPSAELNEVPRLRSEFHSREVKKAFMFARVRYLV